MGNRANIIIQTKDHPNLYLYSHWDGWDLLIKLKNVLSRHVRWGDDSYLARMIFCEMTKGDINGEIGYGISTYYIDGGKDIYVDMETRKVNWSRDLDTEVLSYSYTFTDFITLNDSELED